MDQQVNDGDEDEVDGLVQRSMELKNNLEEVLSKEK